MMRRLNSGPEDILVKMADLYKQATTENSHHYTAAVLAEAIAEIARLRLIESDIVLKKKK